MTILNILRAYYLYYFIICLIIYTPLPIIGIIKGNDVLNLEGFSVFIGLVTVSTIVIGGMMHLMVEYYIPRKSKRLFIKNRDIRLRELDLNIDEVNRIWSGTYRKFHLIVLLESFPDEGNFIIVNVPVEYKEKMKLLEHYELTVSDEVINGGKQAWYTLKIKLLEDKRIDINILKKEVDKMVETLQSENIEPNLESLIK